MKNMETKTSVGYRQMMLIESERVKNPKFTVGDAINLINKAKHKKGSLFDENA